MILPFSTPVTATATQPRRVPVRHAAILIHRGGIQGATASCVKGRLREEGPSLGVGTSKGDSLPSLGTGPVES